MDGDDAGIDDADEDAEGEDADAEGEDADDSDDADDAERDDVGRLRRRHFLRLATLVQKKTTTGPGAKEHVFLAWMIAQEQTHPKEVPMDIIKSIAVPLMLSTKDVARAAAIVGRTSIASIAVAWTQEFARRARHVVNLDISAGDVACATT
jgi:hypothetical protein